MIGPSDGLWEQRLARCERPGCGGKLVFESAKSGGLGAGKLILPGALGPLTGRCPRCKRYTMRVQKSEGSEARVKSKLPRKMSEK